MGTTVVAHGDAPPVLESSEHILDLVTMFVEVDVIRDEGRAVFLRRNARGHAFGFQSSSEPLSIIASVGNHLFGFSERVK